ncbi:hypothetical protein ACVWWO_007362 [Bradyrhizobium sp. F1.13.1]
MLSLNMPCLVARSGPSQSPRAVLWQLVEGDLEPTHPIAVTFPPSSEAIDALLGTKRRSPRVVPNETKLAITNCTSRGTGRSKTFGAVGHCTLLSVLSQLFVDHPIFIVALDEPVRFSDARSLRRSRSAAQLNADIRPASRWVTERYEGLGRLLTKPTTSAKGAVARYADAARSCRTSSITAISMAHGHAHKNSHSDHLR